MANRSYLGAVCGRPGNYGIVFPDVPGCSSAADTLKELATMAEEALSSHLGVLADFGDVIPESGDWTLDEAIALLDPQREDNWLQMMPINVQMPEPREAVSVLVSSELASEIDAVSTNRTDFIRTAVTHELERVRKSA